MHHQAGTARREQQITALHEQHNPQLHRNVAAAVRSDPQTIQDACAFAWLQLFTHESVRLNTPDVCGWLFRVAQREAWRLDHQSRSSNQLPAAAAAGTTDEERQDLADAVALVKGLPERQARILLLHVAGFTYQEISQRTGDTVRTVERQLGRARANLRAARE